MLVERDSVLKCSDPEIPVKFKYRRDGYLVVEFDKDNWVALSPKESVALAEFICRKSSEHLSAA
jgi:hypothetical protein